MSAMIMTKKELTVIDVAERLHIKYRTALKRIKKGLIRARLEGNEYRITEEDLEAYIQSTYQQKK